jgi:hypothetical protein
MIEMAKTSKTIEITSGQQFTSLLASSKAVVTDCMFISIHLVDSSFTFAQALS